MNGSEATAPAVTQNDKSVLGRIWLLVIIVAAVVLGSMVYIYRAGRRMAAVHGPLVDAAMEIKLEAATAHLWFEETITGDESHAISDIIKHIDEADWYAQAMLDGGTSTEGRFQPLFDSKMRGHITLVRTKLAEFKDIALERWKTRDSAGVGTQIEQKFDSIFADLLEHSDAVETDLQRLTREDMRNFGKIQIALITGCALVTIAVGAAFGRFLRRQMSDAQKLQAANQQLDAANQQLRAGEQQLRAANQQLIAHEQQLEAANEQLTAGEQQLEAANQELRANIAARRAAEDDLKFTQFAVDNAADAAFWMGPEAKFIYVNDAACRALGYPREELLEMTVHDIDPDFPKEVWPAHWKELKERGSFTVESHHRTKDGRIFPVEVTVNFLQFNGKEYNCAFVRDVTERKIAEEQLRQTRDNLEHTARLVTAGEMASGLAHELNQPLCAILNYANACKRKLDDENIDPEDFRTPLEQIASQADRAGEIIRRLRSLIKKSEPRQQPVDINRIVEEVIKLEQAEAQEHGVAMRAELADNLHTVVADDIQVEQVILNLARNSFEAMSETPPKDRQLTIRTTAADGDCVEVAVCDNGKGIPVDTADKIFDSFFSTRPEGLGVGLSLSRSIVEAHGGRIWAEPNTNCGATVRFTLPVKGKSNG